MQTTHVNLIVEADDKHEARDAVSPHTLPARMQPDATGDRGGPRKRAAMCGGMKALMISLLALGALNGCVSEDDALGVAESDLSTVVTAPVQGDCTTTKALDRVTTATADVLRASCSITCRKNAARMGIWTVALNKPDGSAVFADNLGSGPTRAAHADLPYAPGFYSVSCSSMWQDKPNSTPFFSSGGAFVGGNF